MNEITPQYATWMQQCLDQCRRCQASCLATVRQCLDEGGELAQGAHLRLLLDCAEMCATNANFLLRGSHLHALTASTCGTVCEICANSCAALPPAFLRQCAEVCYQCAESCRQMTG